MYDLIIIGAGPAGITAAVYAARKRLDILVIAENVGGQAALSGNIENYTGYQFISGPELALKFQEHLQAFDIRLNHPEQARSIKKQDRLIEIITDKEGYSSRSLIIATGARPRLLNVQGEKEFKNKGLTYCATCDGPFFRDKNVAIVGGGNSALDATLQMLKIASKIYIVNSASGLTADPVLIEKAGQSDKTEVFNQAQVKRIYGDSFVKGIEVAQGENTLDLKVEGVFVEIGWIANSDLAGIVKRNERKEIIIDHSNTTDVKGIFACGDVTDVAEKQIIVACGEGAKAALAVFKYLSTQ